MVILVDSRERLESNLKVMSGVLSRLELKVNWKKTTVIRVARQKGQCEVRKSDMEIEQVNEMCVMISSDGNMEKKVEARIRSAVRMIQGMSEAVLRRKELSKKTNLSHE